MTKIRSLLGPKVIPGYVQQYETDENDEVNVPETIAESLLEQTDAWVLVNEPKKKGT